jgi:head-tail adaptor
VIGPPGVGIRPHRVWLQKPGPLVPTDDGGYEQSWIDLDPPKMFSRIEPSSAVDMQRLFADSTVISTASHAVTLPFHAQLTTKVRLLFDGRAFMVTGVATTDERKAESVLACTELVE